MLRRFLSTKVLGQCIHEISQGKLRGNVLKDRKGSEFFSFLSIPYAKPPLGTLRFKAPEPAENWSGVLDATEDLPIACQTEFGKYVGQEDCLYLNVHTPSISTSNGSKHLKPVIFFIHGGGFVEGCGSNDMYGPHYLMSEEVVLVTINYRLGAFGFLSIADQSLGIPGNAALKDQNMALKWVQQNIHKFGGDPNNVTIFGESAGAGSVHMHMLSPMSKGLFHKVIAQSGSAMNTWAIGKVDSIKDIARGLNQDGKTPQELISYLQSVPAVKIIEAQEKLIKSGILIPVSKLFELSPVVEQQTNEPAFLPDTPSNIIDSGNYSKVPLMMGYTDREGIIMKVITNLWQNKFSISEDFKDWIPSNLGVADQPEKQQAIANAIKKYYFGNRTPTAEKSLDNFISIATDVYFTSGQYRAIQKHLKTSESPIYFQRFSADTKLNYMKRLTEETAKLPGCCHIDPLGYVFNTIYTPEILAGSVEDRSIDKVTKLWSNFARFGKPTHKNDTTIDVEWRPVTKDSFNFLNIGTNKLTPGVSPDEENFEFWDNIYKTYAPEK